MSTNKIDSSNKLSLRLSQLAKYREGWWIILSIKEKDVKPGAPSSGKKAAVDKLVSDHEASKEQNLVLAWPLVVQKIDKERTTVGIKFRGPAAPGRYTYTVDVMTQEFLDCDSAKDIIVDVVDESSVERVEIDYGLDDEDNKAGGEEDKEDDGSDDDNDDDEDGDVVIVSSPKSSSAKKNE